MKGKRVVSIAAAALIVAAPATASATPPAEPDSHASCAGILSVFNEAHPELFGSRSDVAHDFFEQAAEEGIPPGEIVTGFAQAHGGAVETCG